MAMASATGDGDQQQSSGLDCAICFEKYKSGVKIPKMISCGHTFCNGCIESLIKNNRLPTINGFLCPKCRKVSIAPQANWFPTNFDMLSLVDEEEDNRTKSFKYNCKDCSIELTVENSFVCKGEYEGFVCLDCYSKHINHGGIEPLKFLLNKNRPIFEQGAKQLKENYEKYEAAKIALEHRRSSIESKISRLFSSYDNLRTEEIDIEKIMRMYDEGDSSLLESVIHSGRVQSFTVDCNFGNEWLDRNLELVQHKFITLEEALSEMEKEDEDYGNCSAGQNAHKLRMYLELLESRAVSNRSGHQTQGTQSAGNNTASSSRPIRAPFMANEVLPEPGDGEASTSGHGMSSIAASSTIRSERGRGGFINKTRGGRS